MLLQAVSFVTRCAPPQIDDIVQESAARLVGARPSEVAVMNSLTANLHFMMSAFYKPTPERFKIITEKKAFPSDTHAVASQILHHGFDPSTALVGAQSQLLSVAHIT